MLKFQFSKFKAYYLRLFEKMENRAEKLSFSDFNPQSRNFYDFMGKLVLVRQKMILKYRFL